MSSYFDKHYCVHLIDPVGRYTTVKFIACKVLESPKFIIFYDKFDEVAGKFRSEHVLGYAVQEENDG